MNRLQQLYRQSERAESYARGYLDYLAEIMAKLDASAIAAFIDALLEARERGAHIFLIGNGGSATTASHLANDLSIGTRSRGKPFRAISLADNVACLTAIGNDFSQEEVFTLQLRAQMAPGDVVVAISASGNSPNVVKAVEYANARGGVTVGLTGFDGGRLKQIARLVVHVPTSPQEYGPAEDVHMALVHVVGTFLMQACLGQAEPVE